MGGRSGVLAPVLMVFEAVDALADVPVQFERVLAVAVGHAFHAGHQADAAHLADDRILGLQVAQTLGVHHGALAYLPGINALRASEAAAVRIEDYVDTLRGYRVLHLVGKGSKPATMPLTVPVLRVLEACRGQLDSGPLVLRPVSGEPIDRRDAYRMVARIAKAAQIPRHISPHSLRHAAITNALVAGVPLRDAQILARHADPRTTEHYDRARGNLDRHGVHFLTAYVAGV